MDNAAFEMPEMQERPSPLNERKNGRKHKEEEKGSTGGEVADPPDIVCLQRRLGFFRCVGLAVGTIIGSGIFVSPKGVLEGSGSVGFTLVIWFLCGCLSFLGVLAFAELGTLIPTSGGEYMYLLEAFSPDRKRKKTFWGPLIGFTFSWQFNIFARPAAFAIQGLSSAKYIMQFINFNCVSQGIRRNVETETRILASLIMILVWFVNCRSVRISTNIINMFSLAKVLVLGLVFSGAIVQAWQGQVAALKTGFEGTTLTFAGISDSFFSGLWAFSGWGNLNMVIRELKNPKRDLVRAMVTSLATVTVLYIFTNVSYFIVMTKEEFLFSEEVAVTFGNKILGVYGAAFATIFVACSIIGSSFGSTFACGRMYYAAAREGHLMKFFSFLSIPYSTPAPAMFSTLCIALFLVQQSTVLGLIALSGFLDWFFKALVMVALLVLRKTKKEGDRVFRVPLLIPILVFSFSIFLVVIPFTESPKVEYIYGVLFMLVGVIIYIPMIYYEVKFTLLDGVFCFLQKVMLLAPPEDDII